MRSLLSGGPFHMGICLIFLLGGMGCATTSDLEILDQVLTQKLESLNAAVQRQVAGLRTELVQEIKPETACTRKAKTEEAEEKEPVLARIKALTATLNAHLEKGNLNLSPRLKLFFEGMELALSYGVTNEASSSGISGEALPPVTIASTESWKVGWEFDNKPIVRNLYEAFIGPIDSQDKKKGIFVWNAFRLNAGIYRQRALRSEAGAITRTVETDTTYKAFASYELPIDKVIDAIW